MSTPDDCDIEWLSELLRALPVALPATAPGDARRTLQAWRAEIDRALSSQVAAVMHHPDFQRLEATWRGLHYLVHKPEPHEGLRIKVLNVSKEDLFHDLTKAVHFDQSHLFAKVYSQEFETLCGEPYGLLVGDYEFGHGLDDVNMLKLLSGIAAAAHAPLVSNAGSKMFNMESYTELTVSRELNRIFQGEEYQAWKSLRDSEDSRYVALTLPRVLGRWAYGEGGKRVPEFDFEEFIEGRSHDKHLWMGAAWAYAANIAAAYSKWGWLVRTLGVEGGGKVEGLPVHAFPTDGGGVALNCSCEIAISDRREYELSILGFLPLLHSKYDGFAVFMGAQSCQKPKTYVEENANANAQMSAKLNYLLCVSRFIHNLQTARDSVGGLLEVGKLMEIGEYTRRLNLWITNYVIANPMTDEENEQTLARRPLYGARVEVQAVKGKPDRYELVAWLRPYCHVETMTTTLRLATKAPQNARFRPAAVDPAWLEWNDGLVLRIAKAIAPTAMPSFHRVSDLPLLADALEQAGCTDERIIDHCRYPHYGCGCWVVDALLETVRGNAG